MINVFIVEDSETMRESLRSMLSEFHNIRITGYAADETGAIEQINATLPDVVVLDLNLQSGTGVAVLKDVKKHHAGIIVMEVRDVFSNWNKTGHCEAGYTGRLND